jgi:hypothetical protein
MPRARMAFRMRAARNSRAPWGFIAAAAHVLSISERSALENSATFSTRSRVSRGIAYNFARALSAADSRRTHEARIKWIEDVALRRASPKAVTRL